MNIVLRWSRGLTLRKWKGGGKPHQFKGDYIENEDKRQWFLLIMRQRVSTNDEIPGRFRGFRKSVISTNWGEK
jgi:hypothetical protein